MKAFGMTQKVAADWFLGLTEWQKTILITSMNGSRGQIHLFEQEI
jgi:hypothetical protein